MPTFRRVPRAQFERYQRLLDYAFQPESGPQEYEDGPPERLGERWGLFEGDRLLTTCTLYDFDARWRGEWTTLGGLAAVASPPEHRRQGYVRQMIRAALREYRDRGIPWVALWPFDHGFYRRLGWGIANTFSRYECDPDALERAAAAPAGSFEPMAPDDWEQLRPTQLAHGERTTLSLRRSEDWWRERVFERWGTEPYVYAWRDDGEVRGYLVYEIETDDEERTLRVYEWSHADFEAHRQLLRFLYTHDSQVSTVRLYQPEGSALLDLVDDPEAVECTVDAGPMVRLGDVRVALSRIEYPEAVDERVILDVNDPLVEWNDARLALTVGEGQGDCSKTVTPPDAIVDVNTLSQLAAGYFEVDEARRLGSLDCDEETADALSRLFPPETVCLREFF